MRALGLLGIAGVLVACTGPVRVFADSGAGGSTASGAACADAKRACVGAPAPGWEGPLLLQEGTPASPPAACIGDFGTTKAEYKGQIDPGTAECKCTCEAATGISCTVAVDICYSSNCVKACLGATVAAAPNTCTTIPGDAVAFAQVSAPNPTQLGSCKAVPAHSLPAPKPAVLAKACTGATAAAAGCGSGEVCAPRAFAPGKLCIAHSGEVDCPDTFYSAKETLYEGVMDTRACSDCTCGMATSKCGGDVAFHKGDCGIIFNVDIVTSPGCGPKNNGGFQSTSAFYAPKPSGTCAPLGGVLSGTVVNTGAATFCCHPG